MQGLLETPPRFAENNRVVSYGKFTQPFRELNILDVDFRDAGGKTPPWARNLRLKEWQHFGIIHPEYYLGFVSFQAKYMSNSFCYIYDRKRKLVFEHHKETGPWAASVSRELWDGWTYFKQPGYHIDMHSWLDKGRHDLNVRIKEKRGLPALEADLSVLEDLNHYQPLVSVSPITANRPLYTHKAACPVEGTVRFGDIAYQLDPERDISLMDVQKTYYPYRSWWKWATFGGRDAQGRIVAMNICDNLIDDDDVYNENCIWVDGQLTSLTAAEFDFDESNTLSPWRMRTTDGKVEVTLNPEGERADKLNAGVLMSDFHQSFGPFSGKLVEDSGTEHAVANYFGLAEHHLFKT